MQWLKIAFEARKQAQHFDDVGDFETLPLAGIPCTIKECFALENMPQSSGLYTRRHIRSSTNAPVVQNFWMQVLFLWVLIGGLCMWMESNTVYGRSNNPYDLRCTTGGSVVEKVLWLVVAVLHLDLDRILVAPFECLLFLMVFMVTNALVC